MGLEFRQSLFTYKLEAWAKILEAGAEILVDSQVISSCFFEQDLTSLGYWLLV